MDRKKYCRTVALMSLLSESKTIDNADIAAFEGNGDFLSSLVVAVEPVQDLHGYDNPWSARGGKNLLQNTATTQTLNGLTFIVNSDETVLVNGTATATTSLYINSSVAIDSSKTYILSGCPAGGNASSGYSLQGTDGAPYDLGTGSGEFSTIAGGGIRIRIGSGTVCNNLLFKPMIRLASESDASFAPYSNICPISGWTGANIHVSPTTVAADGNTYPIAFPSEAGAVYGGTLNVTNGKLYVNRVLHSFTGDEKFSLLVASSIYARRFGVKLSSISGLPSVLTNDVICSHGVQKISTDANLYDFVAANDYISFYDYDGVYSTVSEFKANLAERYNSGNPVQACFFLKDPIVYDVDPIAIKTLVGQNNIWADTGKVIFLEYES